jgi:hypothetical protein
VEIYITVLRCGEAEGLVRNVRFFVIKIEITLGCRSSSQEEGQEEGDWMKDSDSSDS